MGHSDILHVSAVFFIKMLIMSSICALCEFPVAHKERLGVGDWGQDGPGELLSMIDRCDVRWL